MCFRLAVCIPSYSGRSNGVHFLRKFFVRLTVLQLQGFEVTHPTFEISMAIRTRLPDAFHHLGLVPNDNFYCQTPLKNAKFDLFGSEKCQLANLVANSLACDRPTGYGMHLPAILSNTTA